MNIYCVSLYLVAQLCPILCNPMNYSLPGSSVHGILQSRILEWVAVLSSRGFFPTQGSNPGLLHCRQILYHLSYQDTKESTCNVGDPGLISWRRVWFPTPVFLSGEFHGQTSLVGYSPWACKESDMTEKLTCIIHLIFPPGNSDLKLLFMDQKGHSYFLFSLPV